VTQLDIFRLERLFEDSSWIDKQPAFEIDGETCTIIGIVAYHHPTIQRAYFINATPEKIIANSKDAEYCRSVIAAVHKKGTPKSFLLPVTLPLDPPETVYKYVYFKKNPENNTVLVYGIYDLDFLPI
jgi:hypothetical protein